MENPHTKWRFIGKIIELNGVYKGSQLQNLTIRGGNSLEPWIYGCCVVIVIRLQHMFTLFTALGEVQPPCLQSTNKLMSLHFSKHTWCENLLPKQIPFTKVSSVLERAKATGNTITIHPSLGILGGPLLLGPFLFLLLGNQFHPMAGTCLRWLCLSKGLNPTISIQKFKFATGGTLFWKGGFILYNVHL